MRTPIQHQHNLSGHTDPSTTSTQLKRTRDPEKTIPRKKGKVTKTSDNLITLVEGDLLDISKMIREVAVGVLQGVQMEQNIVSA